MKQGKDVDRIAIWNLKRKALELRLGKASYAYISDQLGVSVATAHQWVRELTAIQLPAEEMEDLRAHEAAGWDASEQRLMGMIQMMADQATRRLIDDPDYSVANETIRIESLERTLADVRKQRALLLGINRPTLVKHNVTIRNVFDEEIEALVAELAGGGNIMSPADLVDAEPNE